MKKNYEVKMKNPKTGKTETYITDCKNEEELNMFLDSFFVQNGYLIENITKIHE